MKCPIIVPIVPIIVAMGVFTNVCSVEGAAPKNLNAAVAAVEKAAIKEDSATREWTSREMARSATREIARSERGRAEKALASLLAARKKLKLVKETKGSDVSAAQKQEEQKAITMRAVEERLIGDTRAANQAARELFACEDRTRDRMAASRTAERVLLQFDDPAVKEAWQMWKAKVTLALKQREKENVRYKVTLPCEDANESQVLTALEYKLWAQETIRSAGQMIEQSGGASEIAKKMAAVETNVDKKKALQAFAQEQANAKNEAEQLIAAKNKAIAEVLVREYIPRMVIIGGLKPLAEKDWTYAKARHLLVRAGFGGTPREVKNIYDLGLYKAVDTLVDFHLQPSAKARLDISLPAIPDQLEKKLRNDFLTKRAAAARVDAEKKQTQKLRQWWLERIVESPRPLQEKLTLFWHGHFANQQSVVQNSYTMYQQNQFFREHAAGSFRGLLYGIVHDPAMIRYLDNNKNVKGHANENLAREIMELFSMGEDNGYTESDIREAGRALTGYNFDNRTGGFRLNVNAHDAGEKTIFGKKGNWSGDDLVNLILEQPATSRFIAKRLFEYFAYQDPDIKTIDHMSAALRNSDYELIPMLKNLFQSEVFYSEQAMGTKIKSPVQLVAGMMRDLGVQDLTNYNVLNAAVEAMGQKLLEPPDVKGWRRGRSWISANRMFTRYNSSADLLRTVSQPGNRVGIDMIALLERGGCKNAEDIVNYLVKTCFDKSLTDMQRKKLITSLGQLPPSPQWSKQRDPLNAKLRNLLVLMTSTPEYQMN